MFTGIIEGLGNISSIRSSGEGKRLAIETEFSISDTKVGDSIAVNGACLTAVTVSDRRFEVDVSPETLSKSIFGRAKTGDRVNLERALRFSDRIDGHLVSGHIDGTGYLVAKQPVGNYLKVTFEGPEGSAPYLIEKGSVAVDGVSLTVNGCQGNRFDVSIIPHTARLTTIGFKQIGDPVNLETDMIGKYVERFVRRMHTDDGAADGSSIDMNFLAKTGFL